MCFLMGCLLEKGDLFGCFIQERGIAAKRSRGSQIALLEFSVEQGFEEVDYGWDVDCDADGV